MSNENLIDKNYQGGCLCGALRYSLSGLPLDAGYRHCRVCQRSSGAPTLAWLTLPAKNFAWLLGEPATYRSSADFERQFCAKCGTQILFKRQLNPEFVDVTLASLDNPTGVKPQYHIWTASQIAWLQMGDQLPCYHDAGPDIY